MIFCAKFTYFFQIARLRHDGTFVAHISFHYNSGNFIASFFQQRFQNVCAVPACDDDIIGCFLTLTGCRHDSCRRFFIPQCLCIGCDTDFLFIRPAMILTSKFYDLLFACICSGNTPCMHVCFCTGALETYHFRTGDDFCQFFRQFQQLSCGCGELGTSIHLFFHCCVYCIRCIPHNHGTESTNIINVFISVHIIQFAAFAMGHGNGIIFYSSFMEGTAYTINQVLTNFLIKGF